MVIAEKSEDEGPEVEQIRQICIREANTYQQIGARSMKRKKLCN